MNSAGLGEAEVRAALNTIVDPCSVAAGSPAGLADMGLVRGVELSPSTADRALVDVRVVIGVTEYGCVMGAPFAMEAYRLLEGLTGVGRVDVELDDAFDWVPDDMSPGYRRRLAEVHAEGRRRLAPASAGFPLLTIVPASGAGDRMTAPPDLAGRTV
jgi:metal-sulfur cluster biosynthetic enzyme